MSTQTQFHNFMEGLAGIATSGCYAIDATLEKKYDALTDKDRMATAGATGIAFGLGAADGLAALHGADVTRRDIVLANAGVSSLIFAGKLFRLHKVSKKDRELRKKWDSSNIVCIKTPN